jgi:hypothetical protein
MASLDDLVVTGTLDTTGGLLDPGEAGRDEKGRLNLRNRVVWGTFRLDFGGVAMTGKSVMSLYGRLDDDDSGAVFGTFSLLAEVYGAQLLIWEGHWAGQCVRREVSGVLLGRGRELFAGRKLRLRMKEAGSVGGRQFRIEGSTGAETAIGVTGISNALGEILAPGTQERGPGGELRVRHQVVSGDLLLNFDGIQIRGRQIFEVGANVDGQGTGATYGSFALTLGAGKDEVTVFEGHWAGHLERLIGVSQLVGHGRGPFAGYRLYLDMEEIAGSEVVPDPNIFLLDGYASEERGVGVTGISDALGGILDAGRTFVDERGRTHRQNQVVVGDLSLLVGETMIAGKQTLKLNAVLDERSSGVIYGAFLLTGSDGSILWKGHWAGRSRERIGSSEMVGLGQGPFAGKKMHLKMTEIAAFPGNAAPAIYILEGRVSEEAAVGVTGFATTSGSLVGPKSFARDELGRRCVQGRAVDGALSLFVGDAEIDGRQTLELDASLDQRDSGELRGRFTLTEEGATLWEGEWLGRLRSSIPVGSMVGRGGNRFSGREILLLARDCGEGGIPGGPGVLLLEGSVATAGAARSRPWSTSTTATTAGSAWW